MKLIEIITTDNYKDIIIERRFLFWKWYVTYRYFYGKCIRRLYKNGTLEEISISELADILIILDANY